MVDPCDVDIVKSFIVFVGSYIEISFFELFLHGVTEEPGENDDFGAFLLEEGG